MSEATDLLELVRAHRAAHTAAPERTYTRAEVAAILELSRYQDGRIFEIGIEEVDEYLTDPIGWRASACGVTKSEYVIWRADTWQEELRCMAKTKGGHGRRCRKDRAERPARPLDVAAYTALRLRGGYCLVHGGERQGPEDSLRGVKRTRWDGSCSATTAVGFPCKNTVFRGGRFCYSHGDDLSDSAIWSRTQMATGKPGRYIPTD